MRKEIEYHFAGLYCPKCEAKEAEEHNPVFINGYPLPCPNIKDRGRELYGKVEERIVIKLTQNY